MATKRRRASDASDMSVSATSTAASSTAALETATLSEAPYFKQMACEGDQALVAGGANQRSGFRRRVDRSVESVFRPSNKQVL